MRIPPGLHRHRLLHAGLAIAALSVPFWANGYTLHVATMALLHILLAISLNLAMGFAGQLTLAHVAIYGVGAYATANAYDTLGLPYGLALAFGAVFAGAAGVFLGLLASRLKQFYFGIVTLSITMFAHWFFIHGGDLTRGASGWIMDKPEFAIFSAPVGIYLTALAFAALVVWTGMNMGCGPFGRQLAALAEIENVCGAFGIDTAALKRRIFILSSMVAGLAGGLLIGVIGIVDPETFHVVNMIVQFLMVILGGLGSIFGGLIGALALTGLWEWVREFQGLWEIALGAILLGFMVGAPYGLYGMLLKWAPSWREPRHAVALNESEKPSPAIARVIAEGRSADTPPTSHPAVVVEDLSKNFGGIAALDGVDLDVRQGEIHAVIGPNGSGKSTLINVLSGFIKPDTGSIALFNEDATRLPPHRVARLGVARTYQNFRLIRRLNVLENVLLGANTRDAHGLGSTALRRASFLRQEAAMIEEAYAALAFVGMDQFAMSGGSELSGGQMRLVEMARAVMARPRLLLLDEPAAGLSLKHVDTAAEVIRRMQSELGVTVVLVEHVLTLVMELSDRVTVLNSGSRLAAGTPLEVREMPEVQAAYLGRRTYERVAADVQL